MDLPAQKGRKCTRMNFLGKLCNGVLTINMNIFLPITKQEKETYSLMEILLSALGSVMYTTAEETAGMWKMDMMSNVKHCSQK